MSDDEEPGASSAVLVNPAGESRLTIGDHVVVVERNSGGGLLRLVAADGSLPLEIAITKDGAVSAWGVGSPWR